jgi:hemolysin activation/secretion protein
VNSLNGFVRRALVISWALCGWCLSEHPADASPGRQIYSGTNSVPGTNDLVLKAKDCLPLHARVELNNENSPGTPVLRLNSSIVYDNLWQQGNSLGLQYSFSPNAYKNGNQWNFYDLPLVADYSAFYRMPLGGPQASEDIVAANPGSFGYDEATRKFNLPPPSGQPDITLFAGRSTIDTGVTQGPTQNIYTSQTTNSDGTTATHSSLNQTSLNQSLTVNEDIGFRLTLPLAGLGSFHSGLSGGLDLKSYNLTSYSTNVYNLSTTIISTFGGTTSTSYNNSTDTSPLPATVNQLYYLPLSLRYDAGWDDPLGTASAGLGLSANLWYSSSTATGSGANTTYTHGIKSFQSITGSKESSGYWVVLNPGFSHSFFLLKNWETMVRADGQWASQPLISNEQFGAGGVNSVRGYHEGEVFGDTGWHASVEQETPSVSVGEVYGKNPLLLRGSVYMDYADTFLLDPQGQAGHTDLWSTGIGGVASIGPYWQARVLFSLPLLKTDYTGKFQPFVSFSVAAQF